MGRCWSPSGHSGRSGWWHRLIVGALVAILLAPLAAVDAEARGPFNRLSGTWRGTAKIRLTSGKSETLRCNAYYNPKDQGTGLGLAIRCASASNRIELRAQLNEDGGRVSGQWEERTYNASGNVTGRASDGSISLSIVGGGFKGTMSVQTSGTSQTVIIRTEGVTLQSVNISLSRA